MRIMSTDLDYKLFTDDSYMEKVSKALESLDIDLSEMRVKCFTESIVVFNKSKSYVAYVQL